MNTNAEFTTLAGLTEDRCPTPLDCGDLAEMLRTHKAAAVRLLITLTSIQLNLQALAYAAYLNQQHGCDLDMDDILAEWQQGIVDDEFARA